ncbi:CBS domain-containing protein CBSX3-mitochondrial [Striga hermonthica]|uniref:CBS domain-containing protein CBSX3-mitochondrial n=1 Tax=Striga hermonthica TaxID=68872 RepID=A0A9N7N113_STRHE|nr:CBS domain-containing protein CBSX3-mitochondrial [Striga hermonthica]
MVVFSRHDSPSCQGGYTIHEAPIFARLESTSAARIEEHGLESTTISDVLKVKGKGAYGFCLWCTTDANVYEAVKSMTQHNVGALVVVKPGEEKSIAGFITERALGKSGVEGIFILLITEVSLQQGVSKR